MKNVTVKFNSASAAAQASSDGLTQMLDNSSKGKEREREREREREKNYLGFLALNDMNK